MGWLRRVAVRCVAQQGDHRVEVFERLVCAGADHCGGARDLRGLCLRAELERAGVQAQQRDPVGEDVVHLSCYACALGGADLFDSQLLFGLRAADAFALRLAPAAHDHSRRDDRHRDERVDDILLSRRDVGLDGLVDRRRRELQPGDEERLLPAAVRGDGEQEDHAGRSAEGRERDDRRRGKPEAEGPAPPPPQGEAERRAADHIEDEQRPVEPVVDDVGQRQAADQDRQQEQCGVDDPVPPRAGCGWRLVFVGHEPPEATSKSAHNTPKPRRRDRGDQPTEVDPFSDFGRSAIALWPIVRACLAANPVSP